MQLQFFGKKSKSSSRVGLIVQPDRLAIAQLDDRNGAPYLLRCEVAPLDSPKSAGKVLAQLVKELELERQQVSYVLNPKEYHLHLVEAPNVEPEELSSAVRWKIKDLLDIKVEEAAIDVFQVPEDAYRGRDMVYAVAATRARIEAIVSLVNGAGLQLAVIDIPELVMKNITTRYVDDSNGIAFMDLRRTGSTMNISHQGDLYLTRRINTQLESGVTQSPQWEGLKDRLVLEIQRSLDYYESQMGRGQINRIMLAQRPGDSEQITAELNSMLAAEVVSFNLAAELDSAVELTPELQQIAFGAIGATLRGSKKPQAAHKDDDDQEAA